MMSREPASQLSTGTDLGEMTAATRAQRGLRATSSKDQNDSSPGLGPRFEATIGFSFLAAPTVVHVSKLSPEAISDCDFAEVEYVVIEPTEGGVRLRPASVEDQVEHEHEAGLGRVTYSFGEFLDEFTNAPFQPAPTFDRLAQFKRDYAKLTPSQRQLFRAAAKKFVAPLSTTPPGDYGETLVQELPEHPGFFELRCGMDVCAIFTFGQAIRKNQPHVIWCRIGGDAVLDKPPAICRRTD